VAKNIPNDRKIDQRAIKCTTIFNCKAPPKFTQIGIFWLENLATLNQPRSWPSSINLLKTVLSTFYRGRKVKNKTLKQNFKKPAARISLTYFEPKKVPNFSIPKGSFDDSRQGVRFLGIYTLKCCCHHLICIVIVCT
jgi:hypothetical protein